MALSCLKKKDAQWVLSRAKVEKSRNKQKKKSVKVKKVEKKVEL
jgi:hypothetical protein